MLDNNEVLILQNLQNILFNLSILCLLVVWSYIISCVYAASMTNSRQSFIETIADVLEPNKKSIVILEFATTIFTIELLVLKIILKPYV